MRVSLALIVSVVVAVLLSILAVTDTTFLTFMLGVAVGASMCSFLYEYRILTEIGEE